MATEEFTRKEFEKALTDMSKTGKQLWEYVGVIKGVEFVGVDDPYA